MPRFCSVIACSNRSNRETEKKFFGFPGIRDRRGRELPEGANRRRLWLKAINRKDLTEKKLRNSSVCSDHFLTELSEIRCGIPKGIPQAARIVGGYDVGYYKYPWFASLISENEISCGGTLIGPRKILTAAHCFKPYFKNLVTGQLKIEDVYKIKLGVYNSCMSEATQKEYRCAKVEIHEKYFDELPYFDIAVITLSSDTDEFTPVCLPKTIKTSDTRAKEGTAQGFGRLNYSNETLPCTLQEARLLLHPDRKCMEVINATENNGNNLQHAFCAGYLDGKFDTCLGDSGGPLLITDENGKYTLQGITSYGFGCAEKNVLGVYTDVSHFLKWIYDRSGVGNKLVLDADNSTQTIPEISKQVTTTGLSQPTVTPSVSGIWLHPLHRPRRRKKRRRHPHKKLTIINRPT